MKTQHEFIAGDSRNLKEFPNESVSLIVTSPPYPMIEMWDEVFSCLNPETGTALSLNQGTQAFELMHQELDKTWAESFRVLQKGGIACINIGDATRTLGGQFQLFPNHSRIIKGCLSQGFSCLPAIIWRKETNAPNKFMGSGMMPPGAYVTLEHEYILIFRKGNKREFKSSQEKENRRESAFFWEERNTWFSDIWLNLKGSRQKMSGINSRNRSGAFPFELAYRLVNMFSVKRDLVLDPFAGTGTVMLAAMSSERNSKSVDIDKNLQELARKKALSFCPEANKYLQHRIDKHLIFVREKEEQSKPLKYYNNFHGFPVMTKQEIELKINTLAEIKLKNENFFTVNYRPRIF